MQHLQGKAENESAQRLKGRDPNQRGSSTVEVALILPIYSMLLFGIVSLSLVFFGYCSAVYASHAALRYAMVHGSNSSTPCASADVTNIVVANLWGAPNGSVTVSSVWSPDNSAGSVITIGVSITYKTPIPFSSLSSLKIGTTTLGTVMF